MGELYSCHYCGTQIPSASYICKNCSKVCREKVASSAGKRDKAVPVKEPEANAFSGMLDNSAAPTPEMGGGRQFENIGKFDISLGKSLFSDNISGLNDSFKGFEPLDLSKSDSPSGEPTNKETAPQPPARKREAMPSNDKKAAGESKPLKASGALLEELLSNNRNFYGGSGIDAYKAGKEPRLKLAIVTCASPRLVELCERALGINYGDAFIIRVMGASISAGPDSEVMRSLAVAVHKYAVEEIIILNHDDCGLKGLMANDFITCMKKNDVPRSAFESVDIKSFIGGFSNFKENIRGSVAAVRNSAFIPETIAVHGMLLSMKTGKLEVIVNGYTERNLTV